MIKAEPTKYNNGKPISRQKINQIKNGENKNLIKAAIYGNSWIRDNFTPDVHRVPTKYPLDCIEVDFTKVHASMVDDRECKITKFICRIKDRCTGAILGLASGRSECFELFQIAFRRMLELTGSRLPAEIVYDESPAFRSKEFLRLKEFLEGLGVQMTETSNCQAKGAIESHFKTLFDVYLPQYVGSLGGNIATTKKHRPKHEIFVLLQKTEYMENELEWERILREINEKYNRTPTAKCALGRLESFHYNDKPHSIRLETQFVAYLSWHHTSRKFVQTEFLVQFDRRDYHFRWDPKEINQSLSKQKFVTERTGDVFDVYMHPEKPSSHPLHVFEADSIRFVGAFPLAEMHYGNSIDQKINPERKSQIQDFLRQRSKMVRDFKNQINTISKELRKELGVDLFTLVNEIRKNGDQSTKAEDPVEHILALLENRVVSKIDPTTSTAIVSPKRTNKKSLKVKPTIVKFKSHGKTSN